MTNRGTIWHFICACGREHERRRPVVAVGILNDLREAALPFVGLADEVDRLGHSDDSTCPHRLRAGDLRKLRSVMERAR